MKILGIETSCDETAAAVVEDLPAGRQVELKILSNVIASSAEMHAKTGGIIPEQAARQQVRSIIPIVNEAIGKRQGEIDAIAVTVGPGLIGSLLVGVETAKTLSYLWNKPIVPVNHLVAHIYANFIRENSNLKSQNSKLPEFPALALVVSGGHTDLVLMKKHGDLKWIGGTRDDAAGECFDKCARILGLPYPGGPAISAAAANYQPSTNNLKLKMFPRPMIDEDNFDWSFSGLKTAVLRTAQSQQPAINKERLAAEIQEAIVDSLVIKTVRAIKKFRPKSLLLAGGVAANRRIREKFTDEIKTKKIPIMFHVPEIKLCTDNATYIAAYAYFNFKPVPWKKIEANPELTIMGEV